MADSDIAEFKHMIADFSDVGALAAKVAVVLPLAGLAVKLGPPPVTSVSVLSSLAEFLVLVWAFHFWFELPPIARSRRMKIAVVCFSIALMLSLALMDMYTLSSGVGGERVVKGFDLQDYVKPHLGVEFADADDALRAARFDAAAVWQQWSVTTVHVILIALWLLMFCSLTAFLALFVIARRRERAGASLGKTGTA
jgi:hypothetical protein